MALYTGTQDARDLLAVRTGTALSYGLDRITAVVQAEIAAHSAAMRDAVGSLAVVTTERASVYGLGASGEAQKVNEYGRAATQKPAEPSPVGLPLEKYQYPIGYTANFLKTASPADVVSRSLAAADGLRKAVQKEIRLAFFGATNRTKRDHLVDRVDIPVKAFVNADSAAIPGGPNGEEFDGATHTHYDAIDWGAATAAQKAAALSALVLDIVEHGHGEAVRLIINRAQETDVRGLTAYGFTAYLPANIVGANNVNQATGTLDVTRADNRAIGTFEGAEVWVKPWVPANYIGAYAEGDTRKPLGFRQRGDEALQGFQLAATNLAHPLYADFLETEFGVGAWTRTNGAALYLTAGTYASPTT